MSTAAVIVVTVVALGLMGFACGYAFFVALRATVDGYVNDRTTLWSLVLTFVRFVVAFALFAFAAHLGAAPTLAALLGFTLARVRVVHSIRESG